MQWLLVRWLLLLLLVVVVVAVLTIWKGILRQLWRMLQMQVLLRLLWEVLLRRRQVRRKERLLQVHIIEVEMLLHVHEMLLQVHIILRQRRAIRKWASCSLPCMIPSLAQILKRTLVLRLRHVSEGSLLLLQGRYLLATLRLDANAPTRLCQELALAAAVLLCY